ncbi:phosphatase PAP2 family protein [Peptoniphilus vaginalis]|uniref:phosphatase PAP2 family protein n=1 Tax=Peptoniphilus vaginalis TaxID=1756987 RepID=UPI000A26C5F4|nr:phosphatase PAP2 family protein [Peptoniphilus vaginalis]
MDSKFLNWLLGIRNEVLNRYMIAITHLGTGGAIWLFTVYILFYLGFRIESINVILALIFNGIVCNLLLKNILKRKRPSWITKVELLIKDPTDFSFPSGHASSSFAAALTIYFYFRGMGIFFLVIATLIAFSRIYHFVHYPSDVIIGAIIGIIIALVTKNYYDKFLLDFMQVNLPFLFGPLPKV